MLIVFMVLTPLFCGIYREICLNFFLVFLIIINIVGIIKNFLDKNKIFKFYLILILFSFTFLISYFFGEPYFPAETIKNFFLIFLLLILVFNSVNILKNNQNLFIKIVIISTTLCSIISMISIFLPNFFNEIYIYNKYGDFYKTSIDRLYGTLNYPNALALFNLIGIILSFKFIDKTQYKFSLYLNLLCLLLTMSKSIIFLFIIILLFFRKNYKFIISIFIPILINVSYFRIGYINNNLIILVLLTIILFFSSIFFSKYIEKNVKNSLIAIFFIMVIAIFIGDIPLKIDRTDKEIILADLMNLEKNSEYVIDVKYNGDKNGILMLKKFFIDNGDLNFVLEKTVPIEEKMILRFKTSEEFEFYSIVLQNYEGSSTIEKIELKSGNQIKEIPVNYFILPYNYVTMFYQIRYDVSSLQGRKEIYDDCLKMIKNNVFVGKGYNSFKKFSLDNQFEHKAIEEHSYILRLSVENGIFSSIFWILILIYVVIKSLRSYECENYKYFNLIIFVIIFSSLYDFTLSYGLFFYLLFCFGLFLKPAKRKDILCICSAGGHLTAMKKLEKIYNKYNNILIT